MHKMNIKISLEEGAIKPHRAHDTDAGADLFSNEELVIPHGEWRNVKTGVHIELPHGFFGLIASKSGPNTKNGITCRGIIDEGYSGEIIAPMQNIGPDYEIKKGQKITQLIVIPCVYADFVEGEVKSGDRGDKGLGSTGL